MKALIIFKQFLHDVRRQKLRTFLTTFGIIWGTAATVILLAFGEGMYIHQNKQFLGLGEKLVIMWPGKTSLPYKGLPKGRWVRYTDDDVELLKKEIPEIIVASPEYSGNVKLTLRQENRFAKCHRCQARVGHGAKHDSRGRRPLSSIEYDLEYRKRVIFLGNDIRKDLFGEGVDPVGKYVTLHGAPFLVVGVLKQKDQNSSYRGRDGRKVYIPVSTFKAIWGHTHPENMVFQVSDPSRSKAVCKEVFPRTGTEIHLRPQGRSGPLRLGYQRQPS